MPPPGGTFAFSSASSTLNVSRCCPPMVMQFPVTRPITRPGAPCENTRTGVVQIKVALIGFRGGAESVTQPGQQ